MLSGMRAASTPKQLGMRPDFGGENVSGLSGASWLMVARLGCRALYGLRALLR